MMLCDWFERGGYRAKLRFGSLLLLKIKKFLERGRLLWEVPFGGQSAIQ
jgi:hypothetical protein